MCSEQFSMDFQSEILPMEKGKTWTNESWEENHFHRNLFSGVHLSVRYIDFSSWIDLCKEHDFGYNLIFLWYQIVLILFKKDKYAHSMDQPIVFNQNQFWIISTHFPSPFSTITLWLNSCFSMNLKTPFVRCHHRFNHNEWTALSPF